MLKTPHSAIANPTQPGRHKSAKYRNPYFGEVSRQIKIILDKLADLWERVDTRSPIYGRRFFMRVIRIWWKLEKMWDRFVCRGYKFK